MIFIDFLIDLFQDNRGKEAVVWKDRSYDYGWMLDRIHYWNNYIETRGLHNGALVSLEGDFSPDGIALVLALIDKACIIVPLSNANEGKNARFLDIAQVEFSFTFNQRDEMSAERGKRSPDHRFYEVLKERGHPGLVLFTSGTSGEPKAAVHDFKVLLEKFMVRRASLRTLNFLLFDHWGGLNTMFHTLSNSGTIITVISRSPDEVCEAIEKHNIELLPTSPTFLNLLLISEAYQRYDLSSLKIITYGTEPMPQTTLLKLKSLFPHVKLQQTYGLIEVGVLRSRSKSEDSLWVKVGGEGYETRIVDGILQIKARSAMIGYLNAPSPFTEDGWFDTGDSVEVEGDYIKILGRKSEIINVGGEKVYPAEVENVIQGMDNVRDVVVYGEKNPIMGSIVCAKISIIGDVDERSFFSQVKKYCRERLANYKVPVKISISGESHHSDRFKKIRCNDRSESS